MSRTAARGLLVTLSLPFAAAVLGLMELVLTVLDVEPPRPPAPIAVTYAASTERDEIVWDRDLLYRYAPNSELLGYYRTNSLGYRGGEFLVAKPAGVTRIICVGDSCTFGLGIREEETWTRRLESILNKAYEGVRGFEVLSFGVVGYSSFQTRRQLETEVPRFHPDLVIDMPTAFNDGTYAPEMSDAERGKENGSLANRARQLRIARLLGVASSRYERPTKIVLAAQADAKDPKKCRVPLEEVGDHVAASIAAAEGAGARMLIAISTLDREMRDVDWSLDARLETVRKVAAAHRVALAEPGAALRAYEPYSLFMDQVHPDRDGQRVLARTIFEALVRSDLLPSEPRRDFLRFVLALERNGCQRGCIVPGELLAAAPASFASDRGAFPRANESAYAVVADLVASAGTAGKGRALRVAEIEANVYPRDPLARFLWGEGGAGGAPDADALRLAVRAANLEEALGADLPRRDLRLGAASAALLRGDGPALFAVTDAILALNPAEGDARMLRARFFRSAGDLEHGRFEVDLALAIEPEYGPALALAGIMALESNDLDRAEPLLEHALRVDPFAIDCRYGLALLRLGRGDKEGARRELNSLIAVNPNAYPEAVSLYESLRDEAPAPAKSPAK